MNKDAPLKRIAVLVAILITLLGQYLINAGKTALKPTGEVAGREPVINYTLPPGWAFSIWGVIYAGFLIYALAGVTRAGARDLHMQRTAGLALVSILLNLAWTVVVGLDLWAWAYPLQGVMLVLAILLLQRWETYRRPLNPNQKWLSIPFALYAGWVTVAMIPFTASLLNQWGWSAAPFSRETWGLMLYIVAFGLITVAFLRLKHPFFLLPLAWALLGYVVRFDGALHWTAAILGLLTLALFLFRLPAYLKA